MSDNTITRMSENDALRWLVERSPVTITSYPELARVFGWQRTRAWRVVHAWKRKGWVETETAANDGRITIRMVPNVVPIEIEREVDDDDEREDANAGNPPFREGTAPLPDVRDPSERHAVQPANEHAEPAVSTVYARYVDTPTKPRAPADRLDWMARLVAIGMACITAYFSIHGLLTLFPGDEIGVTVFGIGVECLKVVGVMYLSAHAKTIWWLWRWCAIAAVIIAASLNSASVYAKFAALHSQSPASAAAMREASASELDARIEAAQSRLDDVKRRAGAIDATVENAGRRGSAKGTTRVVNNTRGDRSSLSGASEAAAKELAGLKAERGRVVADGHRAAAEELPVTLMASLFTTDAATVLRWLVCAVVICGDPAALILLAAVGSRAKRRAA
jgi:hypothetical protein